MFVTIVVLFVIGYLAIALEHPLKVEKTASALLLGMLLWGVYLLGAESIVPMCSAEKFQQFLAENPYLNSAGLHKQTLEYVLNVDIIEHLGDITQTLLFLIGAMTIVELIDVHGGFSIITNRITTRNKRNLLWVMSVVTFLLSAVLDNLTTTIVMLMLLRKLVDDKHERWLYASAIVLAANSGGAWSPIGDVTTIMLWVKGNVTVSALITYVFLPSVVSVVLPLMFISRRLKGSLMPLQTTVEENSDISRSERMTIFVLGICGLLLVPVLKTLFHFPPFVGILLVLGGLWVFTEVFYNTKMLEKAREYRLPRIIAKIDMPSILFFLGILMAVAVLQSSGILSWLANTLDDKLHNIYLINVLLGILSSIIDNVPMVAAAIGMYPVTTPDAVGYAANFMTDGHFWGLLSYCAGVGGSMLIIGSAAGVIAMGIEKINFGWYLKNITWLAALGYFAGVVVYLIEHMLF
ncbi:MAG: sodium:proton antiporter NhaD [Muribaculaceae bacterium]|nr:sodium:proton antiporter NhaD [Muribaculaceae bacterium]